MSWDLIENKWAAMTRRLRPDWPEAATMGAVYPRQGGTEARISLATTDGPLLPDSLPAAVAPLLIK